MPLATGDRLGPYEIVGLLGAGGMGEVYRARDPRLGRDVAIKVSKEQFSERFEREARAVAALNHPNICHLYDVGASPSAPGYLVMELVEGEAPKGPLPAAEVERIAGQMASALEAAHEKGIVHRDLKPANIKITSDGTVKILDFGLAKQSRDREGADPENSPTLTMGATQAGMILGTAAYMSPEQARGKSVDKRADIWAFGIVIYELLTGEKLHHGETVSDSLASVLTREPDLNHVPSRFRALLRRCLEKEPKKRLRDIGDAMPLMDDAPEAPQLQAAASPSRVPWAIAALFAVAAIALAAIHFREKPPAPPAVARFQIRLPSDVQFTAGGDFTVSPDGHHLAFSAVGTGQRPAVWIQDLDSLEARPLTATYTGPNPPPFFWSPDSRYVVYSENSPKLKKVDITNGSATEICDKEFPPVGGSWNNDGTIIFGSTASGLWRVPASGGKPTPLTTLDASKKERQHELPSFLPDGRHFLYLRTSVSNPEDAGLFVGSLDDPPDKQSTKRLLATNFGAYYVAGPQGASGWLVSMHDGTLMAQPFDPAKLELSGEPAPVAEGVGSVYETGYFSAAGNALVYRTSRSTRDFQLTWFGRDGKSSGTVGEAGNALTNARFSPDSTRVAYRETGLNLIDLDIWLLDPAKGASTRLTFGPRSSIFPVWSPDGTQIVYGSDRENTLNLYIKPTNGATEEQLLLRSDINKAPESWSSDGRFLLYIASSRPNLAQTNDIWVLPMQGSDRTPFPFQQTRFEEYDPRFSPDGRWVAYASDESGRPEVYVREFTPPPGPASPGGKWLVSKDGGEHPEWKSDGKELVYQGPDRRIFSVSIDAGRTFKSGTPKELFQHPAGTNKWAVTGDLKRFLIPLPTEAKGVQAFDVTLNWTSLIRTK